MPHVMRNQGKASWEVMLASDMKDETSEFQGSLPGSPPKALGHRDQRVTCCAKGKVIGDETGEIHRGSDAETRRPR